MMENDDKLLDQFFTQHRKEIADNGFSRKVMRQLPKNSARLSQIWTTFCFTLALVLFIAFDGLQLVLSTLHNTLILIIENGSTHLDLKSLIVVSVVLLYFIYRKISTLA